MRKNYLLLLVLCPIFVFGQNLSFQQAYQSHPNIPAGLLETVSWTQTRMDNIDSTYAPSCTGMPLPYGVMGVFDNGANYFKENGAYIAQLSGISVASQKASVQNQILAYASAFEGLYTQSPGLSEEQKIYNALIALSHIPDSGRINYYAKDAQVYEIMNLLNDSNHANQFSFLAHNLDLQLAFGIENLNVLSADKVIFTQTGIETTTGETYMPLNMSKAPGYGSALWAPTPSCNYSSRNGTTIQAITIHTAQGSYAGTISWAQNCASNVSYHYVLRSSDGQITQMLEEYKKGWHVGNSNPYTIGYEHEGYISNASWYTNAMYQTSAALSRHITTKSYDAQLKKVRTFYGASTSGTNTLGACTRIKGHQHFANQNHTDPGIHWDWEEYYKLVNANPNISTITSASGSFYDSGGANGNYGNDERKLWFFAPSNVSSVSLNFTSFNIENNWDYLFIYDGSTTDAPLIGKYTGTTSPGLVTSSSDKLLVEFRSDCADSRSGWAATISSVANTPPDVIPPSTSISLPSGWKTQNFQADFTDEDDTNGSGVEKAFYHVGYLSNGKWTANPTRGFIHDDFEGSTPHSNWTIEAGSWSLNNGKLKQTDDALHNNNIYMALDQSSSNNYLYHWKTKFGGTVGNRRGGLYIHCSDPTGIERGDSYFIWFRVDDNKVQFYKVENNNFGSPLINVAQQVDANTEYDIKLSFDRISGKMQVYMDDVLVGTYVDPNPLSAGSHVSFRSGNATMEVDDFYVYRSRYPNVDINVGATIGNDIRTQNPDPNTSSGRIKSVVKDNQYNISTIVTETVDVDWTAPENLLVNDGHAADIDTVYQAELYANWDSVKDPHSGLLEFEVAIGTTAGDDDVMPWTNKGLASSIAHLVSNPVYNQVYYVSVKAKNGAGLVAEASSDGQAYVDESLDIESSDFELVEMYPNPTVDLLYFEGLKSGTEVKVYNMQGKLVLQENLSEQKNKINVKSFASGAYNVVLLSGEKLLIKKMIKK